MLRPIAINLPNIITFGVQHKPVKNLVNQVNSGIIPTQACLAQAMHQTGNYDR